MRKKLDLPRDYLEYLSKKRIKRLIPCFLLTLIFGIILYLYGQVIVKTDVLPFRYSVYALIMLVPFYVTGVPLKMLDKTYCGKIEKVFVDTVMVKDSRNGKMTSANHLSLGVRDESGDYKIFDVRFIPNNRTPEYKEGDEVFHLASSNFVIVVPDDNASRVQCAICGDSNDITNSRCRGCGHMLIKKLPKYKRIY